jgi:hypothetical protein
MSSHLNVNLRTQRQQKRQYHSYLHALVELEKRWKYGHGTGGLQGSTEGGYRLQAELIFYLTRGQVKRIHVIQRENQIVNRLNKTKVEKYPDLRQEREDRQKELRLRDRATTLARVS